MNLKTFIQAERGNATSLSLALGIAPTYLSQMARGDRAVTPERASMIENLTARAVRRWDLRPKDWHLIWPELIGSEGAPSLEVNAMAQQLQRGHDRAADQLATDPDSRVAKLVSANRAQALAEIATPLQPTTEPAAAA